MRIKKLGLFPDGKKFISWTCSSLYPSTVSLTPVLICSTLYNLKVCTLINYGDNTRAASHKR